MCISSLIVSSWVIDMKDVTNMNAAAKSPSEVEELTEPKESVKAGKCTRTVGPLEVGKPMASSKSFKAEKPTVSSESSEAAEFTQRVQELAAQIEPYLIEKRRYFHAHPELSGDEVATTAAIAAELDALGVEYALPNDFVPGPAPVHYASSEKLQAIKEVGKTFVRPASNDREAHKTDDASESHEPENPSIASGQSWATKETSRSTSNASQGDSATETSTISSQSGLIVTIKGEAPDAYDAQGRPRHRIALRSDIDALPILEQTGAPYASQNEGVMHACGHDCHIAMMLGAIRILHELRSSLRGEVRIIFQPAEEISIGSRRMIAAGALDGVESIYGAHIWSEVEAGTVSIESGPRMANTDWFRVDVSGSSAHGAMPHKGVDAIVVGAAIIEALQVVVSRDVSPFDPVVLTIGEFHGGVARNVMAGTSYLTGTVRSFDPKVREFLRERMEFMVHHVAQSYSAKAQFEWQSGNSALINDKACAKRAVKSAIKVLGEDALAKYEGTLSGEDFSEYLRVVPGVFVFVGGRNPEKGADHPQHSCYYEVDESVLKSGSMLAAQYAFDFLNEE